MKRIKIRFHLGRGINYMKWKVAYPNGDIEYISPTDFQIQMINCQAKNSKKISQKIFDGGEKVVCAWILCDEVRVRSTNFYTEQNATRLSYNPRVTPNWVCEGNDVDNGYFGFIYNVDYKLFIK